MSWPAPGTEARRLARIQAAEWAVTVLANPSSLFIDTETTGLDDGAEIIDIAIVDCAGTPLFESLVRPERRIPADATRIHGIVDTMVAGAPRWIEVYPQVERLLSGRPIVVYNADFDHRLVNQMNDRHGYPRLSAPWDCAMKQYGSWVGDWNTKYGNYRWHRLDVALSAFGYRAASHRALDDARACRLVVQGMGTRVTGRGALTPSLPDSLGEGVDNGTNGATTVGVRLTIRRQGGARCRPGYR